MTVPGVAESTVEAAALEWLGALDYQVLFGPDIAPGEPAAERASYGDVVLVERLDATVFAAYGWSDQLSDSEILARLLELNLEREPA
jgi:type I restriction enzyme R subunit